MLVWPLRLICRLVVYSESDEENEQSLFQLSVPDSKKSSSQSRLGFFKDF